jgi:GTP-binding protein
MSINGPEQHSKMQAGKYVSNFIQIAIDGPSGTGKSSAAKGVAHALLFSYLDTGALYRAIAIYLDHLKLDQNVESDIVESLSKCEIEISLDPLEQWVRLNGEEISSEIRTERVSEIASIWSAVPQVRSYLFAKQLQLIESAKDSSDGIVVEGRDIATVVLPNADFKFFLTANEDVRARRRNAEIKGELSDTRESILQRDQRDMTRTLSPLGIDSDATVIDTSELALSEVIDHMIQVISAEDAGEYLLELDNLDNHENFQELLPVVAVLGRPNVGKSTLVNRLIGQRSAVTEDTPGVTRDRVSYQTEWNGRDFVIVDTGGWDPKAIGMYEQVARQAEFALNDADICLMVVDATVGATDDDEQLIRKLREAKVPVLLIANKVDSPKEEADSASLWSLGLGEPINVSALHGRGAGDLLDRIVNELPLESKRFSKPKDARSVAILGRPNVGKSSLLNYLVGSKRAVVSETAGTTVDPIDEYIELDSGKWLFIDTAGIRKKYKQDSGHEYYAVLRTQGTIDRAEVIVVLIDASEELSDQDRRIINMAEESGKAIVICFNKWDQVDENRRRDLQREIDLDLQQQRWIPQLNISATTGRALNKLEPLLLEVLNNWERRIPTSEFNRHLKDFVMAYPHPLRGGRQAKILFGTQVGIRPPTFTLFTSRPLDDGYIRHLERTLREKFDFVGTPIRFKQRIRNAK